MTAKGGFSIGMVFDDGMSDTTDLFPEAGQILRHKPTGRLGKYVKTFTMNRHLYILCNQEDRLGNITLCFEKKEWENTE